ncbi:hypothetical protein KR018_006254 [Drosophila ironensis]|nr:hypothetical protein KR018_006254 [Drosophila ironensis]
MPILEMAIVMNKIYHRIRRYFGPESVLVCQPPKFPHNNFRIRRCRNMKALRGLRYPRTPRLPSVSEDSELSESNVTDYTAVRALVRAPCIPMTGITLPISPLGRITLPPPLSPPPMAFNLERRMLLQRRPLIENIREAVKLRLGTWWQRIWPALLSAGLQVSFGSSVIQNSFWGTFDDLNTDPLILMFVQRFAQAVRRVRTSWYINNILNYILLVSQIFKRVDMSISYSGLRPAYIFMSPGMELIDIAYLAQCLNNFLIDFLINNSHSGY